MSPPHYKVVEIDVHEYKSFNLAGMLRREIDKGIRDGWRFLQFAQDPDNHHLYCLVFEHYGITNDTKTKLERR